MHNINNKNGVRKATKDEQTDTEFIAESIKIYDKNCIGCIRWDRDIMISFIDNNKKYKDTDIHETFDLFLTQAQASELITQLEKILG